MQPMKTKSATGARRPGSTAPNSARIQSTNPAFSATATVRVFMSSRRASSGVTSASFIRIHCIIRMRQAANSAVGSANLSQGETADGRTSPTLMLSTSHMV